MSVVYMLFGLVVMVSGTCLLLLLLYFFYSPMGECTYVHTYVCGVRGELVVMVSGTCLLSSTSYTWVSVHIHMWCEGGVGW